MKWLAQKFIPGFLVSWYHFCLAFFSAALFGFPSRKLVVIGITGTKGKTSTGHFIWSALNSAGYKTGLISTATIAIGKAAAVNTKHMTMPGRFAIERILRNMVASGSEFAVIETTSQGILQWRHKGIVYDIAIFTNLTPEHIEAHGSFAAYRGAKQELFKHLGASARKNVGGRAIPKIIIANADSPEARNFLRYPADRKLTYGTVEGADARATDIVDRIDGVSFNVSGKKIRLHVAGAFNAVNALPALLMAEALHLDREKVARGLEAVTSIPGRMEVVSKEPFTVIVDYAHEKRSMIEALTACRSFLEPKNRLIALIGSEGGGRDRAKRKEIGEAAGELADIVFISTTDPYDEEPISIINEVAAAACSAGKREGVNLFRIPDRREAIAKALDLAKLEDIVILTGMGAQETMIVKNQKTLPWNDRAIALEELQKIKSQQ